MVEGSESECTGVVGKPRDRLFPAVGVPVPPPPAGFVPLDFRPLTFGEPTLLPPAEFRAPELEVEGSADQGTPGIGETKSSSLPPVATCKSIAMRT